MTPAQGISVELGRTSCGGFVQPGELLSFSSWYHPPARPVTGKLLWEPDAHSLSWGGCNALPILLETVLLCENMLPSCYHGKWQEGLRNVFRRAQRVKQTPSPGKKKKGTQDRTWIYTPPASASLAWVEKGNRSNDILSWVEMVKAKVFWACSSLRSKEWRMQVAGGAAH